MMMDKTTALSTMVEQIPNGATIMVSGFGSSGTPFTLIDELLNQGQSQLTLIKNDANETSIGIDKLIAKGRVKKLIATHIGLNPLAMELAESNQLAVELVPQGILAERIRAAGIGVKGFLSTIGLGTDYEQLREKITIGDETVLFEPAIFADVALIHAEKADTFGNAQFNTAGVNFAPLMAMAAKLTLLECKSLVGIGQIAPPQVHMSGVVVNHVAKINHLSQDYEPIKR
ncbi:CoA transferase subunit A [Ostreibacterium oceani]|uniref:3-oxoacid CoA-transferase subunit A n=1 Tax=Ostreibacterium oceani TaxID=2654998 RepID=A0A6N7EUQ7_9GAMM|nr:3-oxoacid CoA-transferase subunit A [Ostreibacterium oceani]MPV85345.1 3-oxoacid CoA-transferase subunit A [Ostreibacterium oceani]